MPVDLFPPFSLIGPLLHAIASENAAVTMVVPKISPLPRWWPLLNMLATQRVLVPRKGQLMRSFSLALYFVHPPMTSGRFGLDKQCREQPNRTNFVLLVSANGTQTRLTISVVPGLFQTR